MFALSCGCAVAIIWFVTIVIILFAIVFGHLWTAIEAVNVLSVPSLIALALFAFELLACAFGICFPVFCRRRRCFCRRCCSGAGQRKSRVTLKWCRIQRKFASITPAGVGLQHVNTGLDPKRWTHWAIQCRLGRGVQTDPPYKKVIRPIFRGLLRWECAHKHRHARKNASFTLI